MRCSKIALKNVGPIEHGEIRISRVNVFIGPNNSGKSIAARVVYGLWRLGGRAASSSAGPPPGGPGRAGGAAHPPPESALVARGAGMHARDIVTHGKAGGCIEATGRDGLVARYSYDRAGEPAMGRMLARPPRASAGAPEDCVYVPAGRTGTMQSLLLFMQIRNDLLNTVWEALGEGPPEAGSRPPPGAPRAAGSPLSRRVVPEYLERFNDLVLEAPSGGFPEDMQGLFAAPLRGAVEVDDSYGLPRVCYRDPSGFATGIDSAGSGTVSTFPVVAALHKVEAGGALIIEEPEAHLEPLAQQRMIAALVRAAQAKNVSLVLTTHSEYVVYPLLSMVSGGELGHGDLGIYRFRRAAGSHTRVEEIPVSEAGEVDQELFEEAVDALGTSL